MVRATTRYTSFLVRLASCGCGDQPFPSLTSLLVVELTGIANHEQQCKGTAVQWRTLSGSLFITCVRTTSTAMAYITTRVVKILPLVDNKNVKESNPRPRPPALPCPFLVSQQKKKKKNTPVKAIILVTRSNSYLGSKLFHSFATVATQLQFDNV